MAHILPLLLRPKLLSLRNRWRSGRATQSLALRDTVIGFFAVTVMLGLYKGVLRALNYIAVDLEIAYLPPSLTLSLIFLMLLFMMTFSSTAAAFGAFFLGRDLELLLASPIKPLRFFFGKLVEVTLASSWMVAVFGMPVLFAFGAHYGGHWHFYLIAVALLIPFFLIPASIGVIVALLFSRFVSAGRTRELFIAAALLFIWALFECVRLLVATGTALHDMNSVMATLRIFAFTSKPWIPSYWLATILGENLEPLGTPLRPFLLLLLGVSTSLVSGAYVLYRLLHARAFTRSLSKKSLFFFQGTPVMTRLLAYIPGLSSQTRAIISKDLHSFSRDVMQGVQLLMLLGLCVIYLYNFSIMRGVEDLPDNIRGWWQGFLILMHLFMGAFFITAACTRLAFPSVSLEGPSFWIVQSSPVALRELLRAKFLTWLFPITLLCVLIFTSGTVILGASPAVVILSIFSCMLICYGVVGLAVGLGAVFAHFDWEHASQLVASFGSLVFMLVSVFLVLVNMALLGLIIYLGNRDMSAVELDYSVWLLLSAIMLVVMFAVNLVVGRWAMHQGVLALERRLR
ncbi:MAG: hypothetical protein QY326_04750 [Bdellovibrionota bacterium]|nr:MAG: hypothetical protein QY326_04750 [Bdellovibrionota bacterium]